MFGLSGWQAKLGEYLIVIAVCFGLAYYIYDAGYSQCEKDNIVKMAKAKQEQQDKYDALAKKLEDTKAERIVQTNTITKIVPQIVEREIYKNVCIDSEGMNVINKAIKGEAYEASK